MRALRDPVLLSGTLTVACLLAVAVLAPALAPFDPAGGNLAYIDDAGKIQAPPFPAGGKFILGTDLLGRDTFSRLLYATRFGLAFAALAVPARLVLAAILGMMAAWWGGFWDRLIRWLSMFLTAVPAILIPLVLIPVVNDLWRGRPGPAGRFSAMSCRIWDHPWPRYWPWRCRWF